MESKPRTARRAKPPVRKWIITESDPRYCFRIENIVLSTNTNKKCIDKRLSYRLLIVYDSNIIELTGNVGKSERIPCSVNYLLFYRGVFTRNFLEIFNGWKYPMAFSFIRVSEDRNTFSIALIRFESRMRAH